SPYGGSVHGVGGGDGGGGAGSGGVDAVVFDQDLAEVLINSSASSQEDASNEPSTSPLLVLSSEFPTTDAATAANDTSVAEAGATAPAAAATTYHCEGSVTGGRGPGTRVSASLSFSFGHALDSPSAGRATAGRFSAKGFFAEGIPAEGAAVDSVERRVDADGIEDAAAVAANGVASARASSSFAGAAEVVESRSCLAKGGRKSSATARRKTCVRRVSFASANTDTAASAVGEGAGPSDKKG
ncbi:unnamed protein product, partial [Laminaria digitata]